MRDLESQPSGNEDQAGGLDVRRSLLKLLEEELTFINDFYQNLLAKYELSVYEAFERRFLNLRNRFKSLLVYYGDPHYEFINRSEKRVEEVGKILKYASMVSAHFQTARDTGHLDRVQCTDAIENLIYAIRNLQYLVNQ